MDLLKFYLGDETHVVIENKDKRKDSLFASQYDYAFKELNDVLPSVCTKLDEEYGAKSVTFSEEIPNNVFAFIGDRGSGKTSCMLSVASMLKNNRNEVIDKKCHVLDVIDPSFFDNKVNILDIVIGKMFSCFKEWIKRQALLNNNNDFESKKTQLYEAFQKVRDCLVNMQHKKEASEEAVEYLADLTCSVELQRAMHQLIKRYLLLYNEELLVISIDDIDLHTECAYTMVEQIRKYLVQNNVIVLMAVKLDQLRTVIENEYIGKYQKAFDNELIGDTYIRDMAARYLVKFVPQSHRIFMPDMKVYMDTAVQLWKNDKLEWPKSSSKSLKYAITELIFEKTRYLFYHRKGVSSPIVPSNLREIRHLIGLLYQMPDYWRDGIKHDENKSAFKHYFFETWVPSNLDQRGIESIRRIESMRDVSIFNKMVLLELKKRFDGVDKLEDWIAEIYNDGNATFNISIGDVFSVIDYVKKRWGNSENFNYIFSLETVYSIRLYEYYDIMTEKSENVIADSVDDSIKKRSMFDEIKLYHILAGGSFLNSASTDYIANDRNGLSRNPRKIKLTKVKDWIKNLDGKFDVNELWAAEWLSLFIARKDFESAKKKGVGSNYRPSGTVIYNESVRSVENVIFDITSLFFNITNIERAYKRVDERLFDLASKEGTDSLYNKLLNEASKRDDRNRGKKRELLSWGCIRNAEILEDFSDYLSSNIPSSSREDFDHYQSFLKKVSNYNIKTYDRDDDNKPYTISFDYVRVILEVMNKEAVKARINEVIEEQKETESLTADNFNVLLTMLEEAPANRLGNLTSGYVKALVKKVVPQFSKERLDLEFERNKSYTKDDIKTKLENLRK